MPVDASDSLAGNNQHKNTFNTLLTDSQSSLDTAVNNAHDEKAIASQTNSVHISQNGQISESGTGTRGSVTSGSLLQNVIGSVGGQGETAPTDAKNGGFLQRGDTFASTNVRMQPLVPAVNDMPFTSGELLTPVIIDETSPVEQWPALFNFEFSTTNGGSRSIDLRTTHSNHGLETRTPVTTQTNEGFRPGLPLLPNGNGELFSSGEPLVSNQDTFKHGLPLFPQSIDKAFNPGEALPPDFNAGQLLSASPQPIAHLEPARLPLETQSEPKQFSGEVLAPAFNSGELLRPSFDSVASLEPARLPKETQSEPNPFVDVSTFVPGEVLAPAFNSGELLLPGFDSVASLEPASLPVDSHGESDQFPDQQLGPFRPVTTFQDVDLKDIIGQGGQDVTPGGNQEINNSADKRRNSEVPSGIETTGGKMLPKIDMPQTKALNNEVSEKEAGQHMLFGLLSGLKDMLGKG